MNSRILNTIANAIDNKEELKKRIESGKGILKELQTCVENCQNRFGGKSELATEDDIRIVHLCEKWEKILSHGLKSNLSNSSIQDIVTAGLNFTFNIINVGNSLWSYSCLHLTKHEKERFKILTNINTPLGYFRAFLRAALNERSLVRYVQSWISHGLLGEYYEEGALVRSPEANILPGVAAGLSTVLFALSIDRPELNDSQHSNQTKAELVIPLPTPVKPSGNSKRKPLRQVISFDKDEKNKEMKEKRQSLEPIDGSPDCSWNSAPPTCLNSPDPKIQPKVASNSEPTSSDSKSGIRHFFPDGVKGIESPLQILSKLSESAKEMFKHSQSSIHSMDKSTHSRDDDLSVNCLKLSESDSEGVAGSIDGSNSCLELCFEDESIPDDKSHSSILDIKEKEFLALQTKCNQIELRSKEKIMRLERNIVDLNKENDRLKEQLKNYMSAVEMGIALKSGNGEEDEVNQYERKLVQVAEMHAELMEFNQHLQRRLQDLEGGVEVLECPSTNVKACIPAAFLVGKKPHTYHVYQIFLKVGLEEWNVYHRYAKFYELHTQLKKCHPDIASYKFPPKKTLRKRDPRVVEQRRVSLQSYLRHVLLTLPELRACTSRTQLVTLLPFFGISSTTRENGLSHSMSHQPLSDTYEAL